MRAPLFLLLWLPAPAHAVDASQTAAIQEYYKDALRLYSEGDYRRAVAKWTEILKVDPDQKSAQEMIVKARELIEAATAERHKRIRQRITEGRYNDARLELQALLDQDPNEPVHLETQRRLAQIIDIVGERAGTGKAWRMAALGLSGYLGSPERPHLAFDALRYAKELDPAEPKFSALLDLLLTAHPAFSEERITSGMKLLEYKHFMALHNIYGGNYPGAVTLLEEILALEPNDLTALKRLGTAFYSLKEWDKARSAWRRAQAMAPKDPMLKKFIARAERQLRTNKRSAMRRSSR